MAKQHRIIPDLASEEMEFCKAILVGIPLREAFERAYPKECQNVSPNTPMNRATALRSRPDIAEYIEYLKTVEPSQLVDDLLFSSAAFGDDSSVRLKAASDYLKSKSAEKDTAQRFLELLREIEAEIVVPCEHGLHRQRLV